MIRTLNGKHLVGVFVRINMFSLRWHKLLWGDIRYYQKKWQVVPCTRSIQTKIVARDDNVDKNESGKLARVIRRGYVILIEVNSLTH